VTAGSMIDLSKTHVGEADYLRVFGVISIVAIHSLGFFLSVPGNDAFERLSVNLLRYGRFVFMFVTGLVLFYNYYERELNTWRFYKRRLRFLVLPYGIWTAFYILLYNWAYINWSQPAGFAAAWWQYFLNGNACYHLYYILVAIQFYFFLPLIMLIFKPRRPRLWVAGILAGGLLLCAVCYFILETRGAGVNALAAGTPWAGFTGWVMQYKDRLLVSYLPFYLLGGLAGVYLEDCRQWLAEHRRLIWCGLFICTGLVVGEYFYFYRHLGQAWGLTISVFKPTIYLYAIAVIAVMFRLSLVMEQREILQGPVKILSANSLGIYLMHPAVLRLQHPFLMKVLPVFPGYFWVFIDSLVAVAVSCLISYLLSSNKYTCFIVGEAGNLRLQQQSFRSRFLERLGFKRAQKDRAADLPPE